MFYPLTVYSSMKGLAVVGFLYSFKIDIDFPLCFGVNEGIEHVGMQCSYCVSMSGLHKGQGAFFPYFSIPPPHFTPKIGGKMVEFWDGVFLSPLSG
jgi:hypothetical protein